LRFEILDWGIADWLGVISYLLLVISYNSHLASFSRTGKMPVPQRVGF